TYFLPLRVSYWVPWVAICITTTSAATPAPVPSLQNHSTARSMVPCWVRSSLTHLRAINTNSMKDLWDERYRDSAYVYGTAPNVWLEEQFRDLTPGFILFPAEGEGRNAVYAA